MAFDSTSMYSPFGSGFSYQSPISANHFGTGLESPFVGNRSYAEHVSARAFLPSPAGFGLGATTAAPLQAASAGAISQVNAPLPDRQATYRASPWAQRAGMPPNRSGMFPHSVPSSARTAHAQSRHPPAPFVRGQPLGGTGVSGFPFPFHSHQPTRAAPAIPFPFTGARTGVPQRAPASRSDAAGAATATANVQYAADGRAVAQSVAMPPEYVESATPPEYVDLTMPREPEQAPVVPVKAAEEPPPVSKKQVDPEVPIVHGRTYHVPAKGPVGDGQEIARRIMLVGDPGRVDVVSQHMELVKYRAENREIRVATGLYKGVWVTCISSGMGPDNTEIVMTELHVLNEYDAEEGAWRKDVEPLILLRVGTCGSPSDAVTVGDFAVTSHAVGADNIGKWYVPRSPAVARRANDLASPTFPPRETVEGAIKGAVPEAAGWLYAANASGAVVNAVSAASKAVTPQRGVHVGITWTAPGFYAPQGRAVGRLAGSLLVPDLPSRLYALRVPSDAETPPLKVVNLEMETASLLHLATQLGYIAGAVCLVIAARPPDPAFHKFLVEGKETAIKEATLVGFEALIRLGNQTKPQAQEHSPVYDSVDGNVPGPETAEMPMPLETAGKGPPPGAVEALD